MAQTRTEKIVIDGLKARQTKERNFKFFGIFAVALAIAFLAILLISICSKGLPGFFQYYATFEVELTRERIDPRGDMSDQSLFEGEAKKIINEAVLEFTGAKKRNEKKAARSLLSNGSDLRLVNFVQKNTDKLNSIQKIKFALDDDADSFFRGYIKKETPEKQRRLNDIEINYLEKMNEAGIITYEISDYLFFGSASRNAEMAGIKGAFIGSMLTLAVCFLIAFPLGVATAVYLEEFAPKNKFTELIEININNLAAVPSVVFGILGLAIFINLFGMPRSIPLIGGLVLALMTLPTIIISSRAAIKAVPPSIRDGALAIGASKMQATMHHVVPLAIPGMLTGTIIGMAQALGETAPLLMIMNGGAVWLRRKLERRW